MNIIDQCFTDLENSMILGDYYTDPEPEYDDSYDESVRKDQDIRKEEEMDRANDIANELRDVLSDIAETPFLLKRQAN